MRTKIKEREGALLTNAPPLLSKPVAATIIMLSRGSKPIEVDFILCSYGSMYKVHQTETGPGTHRE